MILIATVSGLSDIRDFRGGRTRWARKSTVIEKSGRFGNFGWKCV
jgi:hypothetical protein